MNHDKVKAKIQSLCPDVISEHSVQCDMDTSRGYITPHEELGCEVRDITLAVVLRAISLPCLLSLMPDNKLMFGLSSKTGPAFWNLEHDNYDQQSDECKQFIGSLIAA